MEIHHALLGRPVHIEPPLLNSASPWATSREDLETLYRSAHTGAVTTRTCLVEGFEHDDRVHQYAFFDPASQAVTGSEQEVKSTTTALASLNTLGYSPRRLDDYLDDIHALSSTSQSPGATDGKPFIVSVTGSPNEVRQCWDALNRHQTATEDHRRTPLLMEINLSCPNIAGKPPPAYSPPALEAYLSQLSGTGVPIGIKLPPYTYHDQFSALARTAAHCARTPHACTLSFITATNTLGSSLVLQPAHAPAVESSAGTGIGGMAGAPLHPLALGNVRTLRALLDEEPALAHVRIIGVGGVSDAAGFGRMNAVGASAVAVATALGVRGPGVFKDILEGMH